MKAIQRPVLYQLLTLPIGIGLLIWLFGRQDWNEIIHQYNAINFFWAIPILFVTVANYVWRALRWQLLLPKYSFWTILRALLIGYFVNLALPRVGEVVRVWALQKNKAFDWAAFGTVIVERVLDLLCLGGIILLFLCTNSFIFAYLALPTPLQNGWFLVAFILLGVLLVWVGVYFLKHIQKKWLQDIKNGFTSLWHIRRQGRLWLYTILIWWSYVAMSYYWFFALPATADLGWNVALGMVALGTLSRIVPLQANSVGIYHNLVVMALSLFGVAESPAFALTFLIHTSQLLFTIFVGSICWIWFSLADG